MTTPPAARNTEPDMNGTRVSRVRNLIADYTSDHGRTDGRPGHFDMMSFGYDLGATVHALLLQDLDLSQILVLPECGTPACAAGWTWVSYQLDRITGATDDIDDAVAYAAERRDCELIAGIYMDLRSTQSRRLARGFPTELLEIGPSRIGHTVGPSREWTVAMLDRLAVTGRVDWRNTKPATYQQAWGVPQRLNAGAV